MILEELIKDIENVRVLGARDVEIFGVSSNSKNVSSGFLFAAIRGDTVDGHQFIGPAVENGAKALLVEELPADLPPDVSAVKVPDARSALCRIAANFYMHPTKELTLVGITGTNGKTTTTYLLESIWNQENRSTGVIGTVDYRFRGKKTEAQMTTPEPLDLMRLFREMRNSGVDCVSMEVSSHALDRKRVLECHFDAAVFTNLSQDHLDYHGTLKNYLEAKKKLFTDVLRTSEKKKKFSIINIDDSSGSEILAESEGESISYSLQNKTASVYAEKKEISPDGITALVKTPWGDLSLESELFGEHNLYNIMAAVSAALALGSSTTGVKSGIQNIKSVPGRLDRVENSLGIDILVDYAHTPDALRNVLNAVRPLTRGNLILVFGCGGDRDPTKRPVMGKIGMKLSDVLFVTSDNPRTESPQKIIDQIEDGTREVDRDIPYFRVDDRREAITRAIRFAKKGDTVLIAGKGHETYQILGTEKFPFDDKEVAKSAIDTIQD